MLISSHQNWADNGGGFSSISAVCSSNEIAGYWMRKKRKRTVGTTSITCWKKAVSGSSMMLDNLEAHEDQ